MQEVIDDTDAGTLSAWEMNAYAPLVKNAEMQRDTAKVLINRRAALGFMGKSLTEKLAEVIVFCRASGLAKMTHERIDTIRISFENNAGQIIWSVGAADMFADL